MKKKLLPVLLLMLFQATQTYFVTLYNGTDSQLTAHIKGVGMEKIATLKSHAQKEVNTGIICPSSVTVIDASSSTPKTLTLTYESGARCLGKNIRINRDAENKLILTSDIKGTISAL